MPRQELSIIDMGITPQHLLAMQKRVNELEKANDYIAITPVRHAISERLVEIRLLLRDGHLNNKGGK